MDVRVALKESPISSDRSKLTIWGPGAIPLGTDGVERKLYLAVIATTDWVRLRGSELRGST